MIYLLLTAVLLVVALGATAIRHVAWWLCVVLPTVALTVWQLANAMADPVFFWVSVAWLVLLVGLCIETDGENSRRQAAGLPPLTKDELRARMWGHGPPLV
jgi:hypothetical protein